MASGEIRMLKYFQPSILWRHCKCDMRERESIEIDLGKSTGMIFGDSDYHIVQADSANNY